MESPAQAAERRLLGVGLSYPLRLNASGYLAVAAGTDLVKESITQLILTDPSERPYLSRSGVAYGTRIRRLVFENVESAKRIASQEILQAISVWEPRVVGATVTLLPTASSAETGLILRIDYTVRSTGQQDFNIVLIDHKGSP